MTPDNALFRLRVMREQELDAVLAIHAESFPGSRSTMLGKQLLYFIVSQLLTTKPNLHWHL